MGYSGRFAPFCAACTASLMASGPAYAASCDYGFQAPPVEPQAAVVIKNTSRFNLGDPACLATNALCISTAFTRPGSYLIRGDKVLVVRRVNRFACVSYKRGSSAQEVLGWINSNDIAIRPTSERLILGNWAGPGGASASFKSVAGKVFGSAEATWPAFSKGDGAIGVASFKGFVTRQDKYWLFQSKGCSVRFLVNGHDMLVSDNGLCGGENARLDGRYFRR